MESEFEFDISGINDKNSKELESIASPADELFYRGWLLPLQLPLRIQMMKKLYELPVYEIKLHRQRALEADRKFRTEMMANRKKIHPHCSRHYEDLGFAASQETYEVTLDKLGKETCSDGSAPTWEGKKLQVSSHSQPAAVTLKLKGSKAYVKSLFSKAFNTRRACNHHCQKSIQRESCDEEDAATIAKSTSRENSHAIDRSCKSFSARFPLRNEVPLLSKLYSKPVGSSSGAAPTYGGAILKRSMSSTKSDFENCLQEAIAHCKKSLSSDPRDMTGTSKRMQGTASNLEGNADRQSD